MSEPGFRIREIFAGGIRNPTYDWNPEYKFHLTCTKTGGQYLESGIRNPESNNVLNSLTIYMGRDLHRDKDNVNLIKNRTLTVVINMLTKVFATKISECECLKICKPTYCC